MADALFTALTAPSLLNVGGRNIEAAVARQSGLVPLGLSRFQRPSKNFSSNQKSSVYTRTTWIFFRDLEKNVAGTLDTCGTMRTIRLPERAARCYMQLHFF